MVAHAAWTSFEKPHEGAGARNSGLRQKAELGALQSAASLCFRDGSYHFRQAAHWCWFFSEMMGVGTTAFVEGFGCRPIAAMRLAPWPASESLQLRNPRGMAGGGPARAARAGGLCRAA